MAKNIEISELKKHLSVLYNNGIVDDKNYELLHAKIIHLSDIKNKDAKKKPTDLGTPAISVKNFTKHYPKRGKPAVNDISFNIYSGQFHAFIGANGAGKTTTIKSIIGAYSPYTIQGEITIEGYSNQTIEAKENIGYIPEYATFPKRMKAKEYLKLMSMLSGYSKVDSEKLATDLLRKMKMEPFTNKCPDSFSSGQKKKMLLAQALIHNPKILIMDEPAANLDPSARFELFEILLELQKEGKAIFLSSHILDEMSRYATYVTILDDGKIAFDGPVAKDTDLSLLYQHYVKKGAVTDDN